MHFCDTHLNPKKYSGNTKVILKRPKMIGYFSVDEHRQFLPDASNLKYLKMPRGNIVHFDLNKGIEDFQPKPDTVTKEKMDFLLRFIVNNMEMLKANEDNCLDEYKLLYPDVICGRGRLSQIMCSHQRNSWSNSEKWSFTASKYKGNIYICQPDGDDEDPYLLNTAYGFKFEQYLMTENPLHEPNTDVPVIESEEFYCVFDGKVDNISLLYNAEMDGLVSDVKVDLAKVNYDELNFAEIKTSLNNARVSSKYCKWWSQSILTGVSSITLGLRTPNGIVTEIHSIPVKRLSGKTKGNWSPATCIGFLKSFLSFVQFLLRPTDCPYTVYKFDYNPKVNKTVQYSRFDGRNEFSFLPRWYIDQINMQN